MATNTNKLYFRLDFLNQFTITAKSVYSDLVDYATNHGTITIQLFDIGGSVVTSTTTSLTGSAADYSLTYSGTTSIVKVAIYCTATESNTFHFTGGVTLDGKLIYWIGYVKPDNFSRPFIKKNYFLELSAADGLADLKNVTFNGTVSGYQTYLSLIKHCLDQNGISLPITVQCNQYENYLMSPSDNLFEVLQVNSGRFVKTEKGLTSNISCYDVLDYLLTPLDCVIFQSNGSWVIQANTEVNTKRSKYDYNITDSYDATNNRALSIDNSFVLMNSDELTTIVPIKTYEVTFNNYNIPLTTSVVTNGTFDTDISHWINGDTNISDWTNGGYYIFSWDTGRLHVGGQIGDGGSFNPNWLNRFHSDAFHIINITGSEPNYFIVTFDTETSLTITPDTEFWGNPKLQVSISGTSSWLTESVYLIPGEKQSHIVGLDKKLVFNSTGDYKLDIGTYNEIVLLPGHSVDYQELHIYFDNIKVYAVYGTTATTTTFDHFYQGINTSLTAVSNKSATLYFSDGLQADDVGNFKIGGVLTSNWSPVHGDSFSGTSQSVYLRTHIIQGSKYKEYIRFTIRDNAQIGFGNMLQLGSKKYIITAYDYDLYNGKNSVELVELIESTSVPYAFTDTELSTINGQ